MSRILLVGHIAPYPARKTGAGQRSELVRRALNEIARVDMLLLTRCESPRLVESHLLDACQVIEREPEPRSDMSLGKKNNPTMTAARFNEAWKQRLWRGAYPFRVNKTILQQLKHLRRCGAYDVAVVRYLLPAVVSGVILSGLPCIVDIDDLEWEKSRLRELTYDSCARVHREFVYRVFRRRGLHHLARCDAVFTASEDDRRLLGIPRVAVLPNIPFGPANEKHWMPCPPSGGSEEILFVSDLLYTPNRDGLRKFVREMWPRILTRCPHARLKVVSSRLDDAFRAEIASFENVDVLGFVSDLRDVYMSSAFTIAPIYWGGGTKIKVLESFAYGRTGVFTAHALRGLHPDLKGGETHSLARTDQEFVEGCVGLLTNGHVRRQWSDRGHRVVMRNYSFDSFTRIVGQAVESTLLARR